MWIHSSKKLAIRCIAFVTEGRRRAGACVRTIYYWSLLPVVRSRRTATISILKRGRCFSSGQPRNYASIRSCMTSAELLNRTAAEHVDIA